jgi:hypothetical protein
MIGDEIRALIYFIEFTGGRILEVCTKWPDQKQTVFSDLSDQPQQHAQHTAQAFPSLTTT